MVRVNCHPEEKHYTFGFCLACYKADYQRKHPVTSLERRIKYYNLTNEKYDRLLKRQGNVCALYGRKPSKRGFVIDHDHYTNKVRGLLCNRCNIALWSIENKKFYERAVRYLKRSGTKLDYVYQKADSRSI